MTIQTPFSTFITYSCLNFLLFVYWTNGWDFLIPSQNRKHHLYFSSVIQIQSEGRSCTDFVHDHVHNPGATSSGLGWGTVSCHTFFPLSFLNDGKPGCDDPWTVGRLCHHHQMMPHQGRHGLLKPFSAPSSAPAAKDPAHSAAWHT